jgi:hypothetical protein
MGIPIIHDAVVKNLLPSHVERDSGAIVWLENAHWYSLSYIDGIGEYENSYTVKRWRNRSGSFFTDCFKQGTGIETVVTIFRFKKNGKKNSGTHPIPGSRVKLYIPS